MIIRYAFPAGMQWVNGQVLQMGEVGPFKQL